MKILALETSARAVSAAVSEDGEILGSAYQNNGLTHSRTLMPLVEQVLGSLGLTVKDCGAVAVAVGPGSFTGIRIGVSTAKGLAVGAQLPCAAVSTLAAMARNAAVGDGLVICAMDARRSQIYNALFDVKGGRLTRLTEDRAIALEDLAQEIRADGRVKTVVGDGARLCEAYLRNRGVDCRLAPPHLLFQNAAGVALEAEEQAAAGRLLTAQDLLPVYLRPPHAQPLKNPPAILREE